MLNQEENKKKALDIYCIAPDLSNAIAVRSNQKHRSTTKDVRKQGSIKKIANRKMTTNYEHAGQLALRPHALSDDRVIGSGLVKDKEDDLSASNSVSDT